ncbi:unnamed protein product [Parascedosporium putredinis]|uniref:DUF1275 domain protein n=1 Tax=Parascedosporium putredinis TaxID=1442378 RepID=A0A9P1H1E4_9PEZI|nr:unnamed protein product [Parascedosporium putredinis]CAI7993655.1 unnamed protein product [Parascedosporium putredinis]
MSASKGTPYGTTSPSVPQSNGTADADAFADREAALLPTRPKVPRWQSYLTADVDRKRGDLILLLCYVITGLLDSQSISTWNSFVSMQTGNTVYLGLGVVTPHESTRWIKSGVSRRWVLCASFALQMLITVVAALAVTLGPAPSAEEIKWSDLLPIALVSFQSCGQAVTSRALKFNSLTSVVLTSIYCDLFSDAELFSLRNSERNRRLAAPLLLLIGALFGGVYRHYGLGIVWALWTAAILKLLIVVSWLVWPAEPGSFED